MDSRKRQPSSQWVGRREVLVTGLALGSSLLAGCGGGNSSRSPTDDDGNDEPQDGKSWMADVDNYEGYVDETGPSEVTVRVGVEANGDYRGFGPAGLRVSPGTTVVWEWTGEGGEHGVVEKDGRFESDVTADAGYTFEQTFEDSAVYRYYCPTHRSAGMKGAVLVG